MLKADNIVSFRQYLIAIGITWFLIIILLARFFQIQIEKRQIRIVSGKLRPPHHVVLYLIGMGKFW